MTYSIITNKAISEEDMAIEYFRQAVDKKDKHDFEIAENLAIKALNLFEVVNCKKWIAKTLYILGGILLDCYEYNRSKPISIYDDFNIEVNNKHLYKAEQYFNDSLKYAKISNDKRGYANNLCQLACILQTKSEFSKSEEFSKEALKIYQELNFKKGIACTLLQLGRLYFIQYDLNNAVLYFKKALVFYMEDEDKKGLANTLHLLGRAAHDCEEHETAIVYYNKSLMFYENLKDRIGQTETLQQLGIIKEEQMKIKNAEKYYRIAVKISRDIGYKEGIKTALDSINRIRNAA